MTAPKSVVILAGVLSFFVVSGCSENGGIEPASPVQKHPASVVGFRYDAPEQGVEFEVGEIGSQGMQFGRFRINLMQDLVLREVAIRLDVAGVGAVEPSHREQFDALRGGLAVASTLVPTANRATLLRQAVIEIRRGAVFLHRIRADEVRTSEAFLELIGGVEIETGRGETLKTDRLIWSVDDWTLQVPGHFELERGERSAASANGRFVLLEDGSLRVPASDE